MATIGSYREFCRRQHRALATYLAIRCWKAGADFVVLPRAFLERYLGIERFKTQRKAWLREDFCRLFPHDNSMEFSGTKKFYSFYFSRRPFGDDSFNGSMTDEERVAIFKQRGLSGIIFANRRVNEAKILKDLALMAAGSSDFKI